MSLITVDPDTNEVKKDNVVKSPNPATAYFAEGEIYVRSKLYRFRKGGAIWVIYVPAVVDGDTITINDGVAAKTYEFDSNNSVVQGNIALPIMGSMLDDSNNPIPLAVGHYRVRISGVFTYFPGVLPFADSPVPQYEWSTIIATNSTGLFSTYAATLPQTRPTQGLWCGNTAGVMIFLKNKVAGAARNHVITKTGTTPIFVRGMEFGQDAGGVNWPSNWHAMTAAIAEANVNGGDTITILEGIFKFAKNYLEAPLVDDTLPILSPKSFSSVNFKLPRFATGGYYIFGRRIFPNAPIKVDRSVKIQGVRDGADYLTTLTCDGQFTEACSDIDGKQGAFLAHNDARVVFENLKFNKLMTGIIPFAPFEVRNCEFSDNLHSLVLYYEYIDDRLVFPSLQQGIEDFTNVDRSYIENNTFKRFKAYGCYAACGGMVIRNNKFEEPIGVSAKAIACYTVQPSVALPGAFVPDTLQRRQLRKVEITDNTIDAGNTYFAQGGIEMGQAGGNYVRDNIIARNVMTNMTDGNEFGIYVYAADAWGATPNPTDLKSVYNCQISENTITGVQGSGGPRYPISLSVPSLASPRPAGDIAGVTVVENNIVNCWKDTLGRRSALNLGDQIPTNGYVRNCLVLDNDFRDSGYPVVTDNAYKQACVLLDIKTMGNVVKESGKFPVGQGGASNHVVDIITGYSKDNRIIGEPAKNVSQPGIGQTMVDFKKFVGDEPDSELLPE